MREKLKEIAYYDLNRFAKVHNYGNQDLIHTSRALYLLRYVLFLISMWSLFLIRKIYLTGIWQACCKKGHQKNMCHNEIEWNEIDFKVQEAKKLMGL